jgi:hypothetical protein
MFFFRPPIHALLFVLPLPILPLSFLPLALRVLFPLALARDKGQIYTKGRSNIIIVRSRQLYLSENATQIEKITMAAPATKYRPALKPVCAKFE